MLCDEDARRLLSEGLAAIRAEHGLQAAFAPDVEAEAEAVAGRPLRTGGETERFDARDLPFMTLDPFGSTDLDQAFALERGDDIVLHYAIADVGFFVDRGSLLESEAMRRGQTVYAPDGRIPQYPEVLCEGAASLLPGVDRPAVLLDVVVDAQGHAVLESARRAVVRSRRQLAYDRIGPGDLPPLLSELVARTNAAEDRRGAVRVELPQQDVVADEACPGGLRLEIRDRLPTEDWNSAMSLAANLAVADRMLAAGVGLFRVMARPDERELRTLHHAARALGISWPADMDLGHLQQQLDPTRPNHRTFLTAARRAGGGASYVTLGCPPPTAGGSPATDPATVPATPDPAEAPAVPWHAAVAATYAHATAPLRRLADRYVLDLVVDLHHGRTPSAADRAVLARLPLALSRSGQVAAKVESAAVDLVEAVTMRGREGEVFAAVVTDIDRNGARIQLTDPPVVARLRADGLQPGEAVSVRLESADPAARTVHFSAAGPATIAPPA